MESLSDVFERQQSLRIHNDDLVILPRYCASINIYREINIRNSMFSRKLCDNVAVLNNWRLKNMNTSICFGSETSSLCFPAKQVTSVHLKGVTDVARNRNGDARSALNSPRAKRPPEAFLYASISEARGNRFQAPRIVFTMAARASACVTRARGIRARHNRHKLRAPRAQHASMRSRRP